MNKNFETKIKLFKRFLMTIGIGLSTMILSSAYAQEKSEKEPDKPKKIENTISLKIGLRWGVLQPLSTQSNHGTETLFFLHPFMESRFPFGEQFVGFGYSKAGFFNKGETNYILAIQERFLAFYEELQKDASTLRFYGGVSNVQGISLDDSIKNYAISKKNVDEQSFIIGFQEGDEMIDFFLEVTSDGTFSVGLRAAFKFKFVPESLPKYMF